MARRFETAPQGETDPRHAESAAATEAPPVDAPVPPPANDTPPTSGAVPELLTPNEWAARKGLLVERTEKTPWVEPHAKGFHAEAAQLHGWAAHAYSEQDPAKAFRLSETDYDAALKAAAEYPAAPAHEKALAPGCKMPPLPKHVADALAAKAKAEAAARSPSAE